MATNLVIANPGIKDDSVFSCSNSDVINMATSPGTDTGGQSWLYYYRSWVQTDVKIYEDALLDLRTNNMLTLAGNYDSSSTAGELYNMYYVIDGIAQKEIAGAMFSGDGGSINFSAQTGSAYVTKSGSLTEKPVDQDIRILVQQGGTIPAAASPDSYNATLNYSANGVYSKSGLLTVTGDLSADVTANSSLRTTYLQKDKTLTNNNTGNVGNASAFNAQNLLITNNFTGTLAEKVQYNATSAYTAFQVNNNIVQAHGILVGSSLAVEGYFGNNTSSGFVGTINSTADNSTLLADGCSQPDLDPGAEKQGRSAAVTGNNIGSYGLRAGNASSLSYSGSITLGKNSGLFGAYGFNGSISTSASNNTLEAIAYGNNPTSTFSADVANNSIRSIGIAAQSLTLNGQFLGNISTTANNNKLSRRNNETGIFSFNITGNELLAAGIYVANLVANNTFAGNITINATGNSGFADKVTGRVFSYGVYASDTITVNGANLIDSPVSGVGRFDSDITLTVDNNTVSQVAGIYANTLNAEAFSGTITLNGRGYGMEVKSFTTGSDNIFDISGSVIVDSGVGIYTTNLMNMRISGEITLSTSLIGGYALYVNDDTRAGSKNDTLHIAAGASITGNVDLRTGSNYIYIDSNATVVGDLLATNGQLNITVALNQFGSVDNTSMGDHYSENSDLLPTDAILQTSGNTMGSAQSGITINLNNAKAGTYKIASGTTWGLFDEKTVSVIYNRNNPEESTHKLSFLGTDTSAAAGTVKSIDGDTLDYRIWLQQENDGTVGLFITVTGDSVYGRKEEIQNFAGVYSEENESVTFSWDKMSLDSQTSFELEYSIDGAKSIVVMLSGTTTSYTIHNILAGESVSARIRLNTSNGVLYSKWYGAADSDKEGLVVQATPESALSPTVGKVDDGNTQILPGNAPGATSTVIDLGWEDVADDCTYGLSHYEMRFIVTDNNITDTAILAQLWDEISESYPDLQPAGGYAFSIEIGGQTYKGNIYSKSVTTNHIVISNLSDNQFYYWQVQAYDTKGNGGGWTDGVRFKVNTTDQNSPILDPEEKLELSASVSYNDEWTWDETTQRFSGGWSVTTSWQNTAIDYGSGIDKYMWLWSPEDNPSLQDRGYTYVPSTASSSQILSYTTKWLSLDYSVYNASLSVWDLSGQESENPKQMDWVRDTTGPSGSFAVVREESAIDVSSYSVSITGETDPKIVDAGGTEVLMIPQSVTITLDLSDITDTATGDISAAGIAMFTLSYREAGSSEWIYYSYLDTRKNGYDAIWTIEDSTTFSGSKDYEFLVTAYDKAGNSTAFTENLISIFGDTTPPVFSVTPDFDYNSDNKSYTVTWDSATDTTGIAYYQVQVYDENGSRIKVQYLSANDPLVCTIANVQAEDKFTVTITAYDWLYTTASEEDKKDHFASVSVKVEADTEPPVFNDPVMNYHVHYSVENGTLLQSVDLSWTSAEDSGAGVKGYWVMYRKQGESEWSEPVWAEHSAGTSKLTLTGLPDGNYEWQIYAVDKRGNESPLVSSTWQNDTQAPAFAEGSSGSHGDVSFVINNVGGESYAQMQVTISWTPAVDAQQTVGNDNLVDPSGIQGYIVEYRYKLPGDADFGAWYSVNSIDNLITGNSITLNSDNLLHNYANATYEWRIQAVDRTGNISSYLEGDSVEGWTGDITAPIFTSTDVTVTVDSNNNVTIDWKAAAQEDPAVTPQTGVKEYIFTLHKEGDPADKTFTVTLDDPNLSNYTFSSSFWDNYEDGTYTWSLVAVDYAGNVSSALTGDSFFIDLDAPHGPDGGEGHFTSLPAPTITVEYNWFPQPGIEGPEDPVEVRDPANITITFDASNHTYEDMTGVYFIYQISLDKTFQDDSKLVYNTLTESEFINTNVYEGDHLVLSTENNGITRLAGYAPGTTFYWRVKAVDGRGHEVANWSQQITPFQLKDSDGNDIVDIYTDPTTPENVSITVDADPNSSATHRISWIPSSDTFGIKGYNIEISNKMETTYLYLPADEFSRDDLYIGGAGLILNSGTYHFRVQAVDGSGRTSDWSEKVSYTVSEDVYTGDGSSSALAYVLDNTTPGTNYYTTSATGEVGFVNDQKINGLWYKFDLPNEGKLDINGRPLGGILNLSVASASTLTITICDDIEKKTIKKFTVKGGTNGVSNIIIDPAKYGDRIYVYVEAGKNVTRAQYTINANISFFESPDYDELKTNPTSIKLNSTDGAATASVQGWVGYQDKGDYYMFTGDAAATVQGIDITGVTGKLKVTLYDNAWKKKASVTISEDAYGLFSGQLIPEVYFVAVETTDSGKGKVNSYYNLNVSENYLPANKPSSNPGNVVSLDANGYYASTDEWVGYGDAVDYYSFSTTHAGALNVSINVKQNATLKVTLYQFVDGKQKKLKSVTVKSTTNNTNLFKDYLVPVGDFMITVESGDKGKGKQNSYYDLMVSDQYKHPASPNSSFATADQGTLVVNQPTTAANDLWVGYGDPVDYYEVNVAGDGVFNLGVYDLSAKVKVFVYEKDANGVAGKKIATATLNAGTSTNSAFKNNLMLTAGNYYVVVESADKKTAKQETAYNLNFNGTYFTNDNHLNDNSAWDVDTVAQAQTLAANETIQLSGWVGFNDASDFFRFELNGSSMVRLDFSNFNSTNLKYEVRSVETNKKVSFDQNGMSKEQLSGAYYVEISTKNEKKYYSNDYTLGITAV